MKRVLVTCVLTGTILVAGGAVARIDPGVHTAFVADNHIVMDGQGHLHLVYLFWDGAQLDVYGTHSQDEGLTWAAPENLSSTPDLSSSEPPDLAVDPGGDVAYVWSEGAGDSASIYLLYESVTGPDPSELLDTGNWASGPKIEIDDSEVVHVVWYDERVDTTSVLGYLRYDTRIASPQIIEHDFIGPEEGYVQWPSLAVDASGGLHVVFSYTPVYGAAPIDLFYVYSMNGGLSWSDTTRLSATDAASMFPHVLVDPLGTVHVVWQEGDGADGEILYISDNGKAWTSPENLSSTPGDASRYPTLSMDGLGTLHLVWSDESDGDFDIYHRSYEGGLSWTGVENVSQTSQSSLGSTQLEFLDGYGFVAAWVEGNAAPFEIRTRSGFTEVLFADVTEEAGLTQTGLSRGAAWADMDNDGAEDLVTLRWTFPGGRCSVWRNDGGALEEDDEFMTGSLANSAAWADFDNDGFRDLAVAQWGGATLLYHNVDGDSLAEDGANLGVGGAFEGRALVWGDYDRDGWVDLYVTSSAMGVNALYHNNAGGGFSDTAVVAGVDAAGADCHGCAWADYDQDGWPDLYVAVYGENLLFHNEGNGSFTEMAAALGVDHAGNSEACSWADIDLDGDLDLFVLNNLSANVLYRNDQGTFVDITDESNVGGIGQGAVAVWEDVDCDGDPDLFTSEVTTGLYRNSGAGLFADVGSEAGLSRSGQFYGAGWADYDSDGDSDLFLSNGSSAESNLLFLNGDHGGAVHNWVGVDLEGMTSNRDGIGARVTLWSNGRAWTQEENGGLGFSQNSGTLRFGLGDAAVLDSLIVEWPSGIVDRLHGWSANQRIVIEEGTTLEVWPGDTDNDGDVDEEDVLPLVVYWHQEGAERSGGFTWTGQPVLVWDPEASTYADADGDGRVDAADLLPIGVNWGRTHAPVPGGRICRPDIEDHGPYLSRYRALHEAVTRTASGPSRDALREYLGSLIALAEGSRGSATSKLSVCHPNPSRRGTRIQFAIASRGRVAVRIYDVTGRVVRTLVERNLPAGPHDVFWDGHNDVGAEAAPGVYLVRMETHGASSVRKVVVVR